jgi:pimeloyl-ACP methyl ester carboxylesterase
MATFILIHGAWHGGWCFDSIRPLLETEGHMVITPDLPGMGGNDAELAAVTLSGWGDFVAGLCREAAQPVILCGHSRGGIVISEAAERAPEAVASLVYVCAMMLPNDLSRSSWREHAQPNPDFVAIQKPLANGLGRDVDLEKAPAIFAQLSPPDLVASTMARLKTEPDGPRDEVLHLTPARYGSVPRHYIECLHDRTIPLADQRTMQRLSPGAQVVALDADHSPFLSAPNQLAEALLSIARKAER